VGEKLLDVNHDGKARTSAGSPGRRVASARLVGVAHRRAGAGQVSEPEAAAELVKRIEEAEFVPARVSAT
jgi:hypothetical protein